MDEFTDNPEASEAAPDQGYDDAGYAAEPGYEEQAATPPDLSDALAQLNERQGHQLYEDDQGYEPEEERPFDDEAYEDDLSPEQALEQLVEQRVSEAVEPFFQQQNEAAVMELAERLPVLRDPQVLEHVDAELKGMAEELGEPSLATDPRMAELVTLAYIASEQLGQGQGTQPQPQQGPVLETGTGPGGPPPQGDDVESAYTQAFAGPDLDDWGFPRS